MIDRCVIGLDLGGTDLKAARITPAGEVAGFRKRPSGVEQSAEAPLAAMGEAVAELADGRELLAVGLGSPGPIDPVSGALVGRTAHLPHWEDFPLGERLRGRLDVPVAVDNDANLAALAEARVGAARGSVVSITVTLGTGVGAGLVIEGRVWRGAFGGAGEIGHLPIGTGNEACPCGVPRCVEPEASAAGLMRAAQRAGLAIRNSSEVFALASRGDALAVRLAERMTDRLGACLAIAVNLLNPEVVVLGGGGALAGEPLRGGVETAIRRYALASHSRRLRVRLAALGERAGVTGAGLIAWEMVEAASRSR